MTTTTNTRNVNDYDAAIPAIEGSWNGRGGLAELVAELDRQDASKIDFCADVRQLYVDVPEEGGALRLTPKPGTQVCEFIPSDGFPILGTALEQLGQRMSPPIPWKFLRDLAAQHPQSAASLVNDLLMQPATGSERRFLRCLDGRVRAVLSDTYRVIDNHDVAFRALAAVRDHGGEAIEVSLSDRRMHMKFTNFEVAEELAAFLESRGPGHDFLRFGDRGTSSLGGRFTNLDRIRGRDDGGLPKGPDTVYPLVTLSNSETGHGGFTVKLGIMQGACCNGLILETIARKVHLGTKLDEGIFSEETRSAHDKAEMLKVGDSIAAAFKPEKFKRLVERAKEAAETKIEAPTLAVANVASEFGLSDKARDSILEHFLGDYNRTAFGLAAAVTRHAQDMPDAEASFEVEEAVGAIVTAPRRWNVVKPVED